MRQDNLTGDEDKNVIDNKLKSLLILLENENIDKKNKIRLEKKLLELRDFCEENLTCTVSFDFYSHQKLPYRIKTKSPSDKFTIINDDVKQLFEAKSINLDPITRLPIISYVLDESTYNLMIEKEKELVALEKDIKNIITHNELLKTENAAKKNYRYSIFPPAKVEKNGEKMVTLAAVKNKAKINQFAVYFTDNDLANSFAYHFKTAEKTIEKDCTIFYFPAYLTLKGELTAIFLSQEERDSFFKYFIKTNNIQAIKRRNWSRQNVIRFLDLQWQALQGCEVVYPEELRITRLALKK